LLEFGKIIISVLFQVVKIVFSNDLFIVSGCFNLINNELCIVFRSTKKFNDFSASFVARIFPAKNFSEITEKRFMITTGQFN